MDRPFVVGDEVDETLTLRLLCWMLAAHESRAPSSVRPPAATLWPTGSVMNEGIQYDQTNTQIRLCRLRWHERSGWCPRTVLEAYVACVAGLFSRLRCGMTFKPTPWSLKLASCGALFLTSALLPGSSFAKPDSQTLAVAKILLAGQPLTIIKKYRKLQGLLDIRDIGRAKMHNGDSYGAIKTFEHGLDELGEDYFSPGEVDDSGMYLVLVASNLRKGKIAAAAGEIDGVFSGRLSGYETIIWRLLSEHASNRDTPSVLNARNEWIAAIAKQLRERWNQDANASVQGPCDIRLTVLPNGAMAGWGIEGTCGDADNRLITMLSSIAGVPPPSIPAAYVPDLTIALFPDPPAASSTPAPQAGTRSRGSATSG